jgi:GAF domain-containing protein
MHPPEVGLALTVARTVHQAESLEDGLRALAAAARASIPGFDHVGISSLHPRGKVETRAASGDLVCELDDLQYSLGEGPCVETLQEAEVVAAPRLGQERRWPRYVPAAVQRGLRSQLALRLSLDGKRTLGGLNLYSTTSDDIGPEARAAAGLFASCAAIALGNAHERDTLTEALGTRKVIGQALGILMERYTMDEDRAFAFLVRASTRGNTKLRHVAQRLVDERNAGD